MLEIICCFIPLRLGGFCSTETASRTSSLILLPIRYMDTWILGSKGNLLGDCWRPQESWGGRLKVREVVTRLPGSLPPRRLASLLVLRSGSFSRRSSLMWLNVTHSALVMSLVKARGRDIHSLMRKRETLGSSQFKSHSANH